jgi:hypothetical protein
MRLYSSSSMSFGRRGLGASPSTLRLYRKEEKIESVRAHAAVLAGQPGWTDLSDPPGPTVFEARAKREVAAPFDPQLPRGHRLPHRGPFGGEVVLRIVGR